MHIPEKLGLAARVKQSVLTVTSATLASLCSGAMLT